MYNVSNDYKTAMLEPIQKYKLNMTIGETEITDADIVAGTFQIKNQCSDADIVQIGSVYTAELKFTIAAGVIERNTWEGLAITAEELMLISEDPEADPVETFEPVPLGVFYVAQANHSDRGVSITAYDSMLKFDKSFNLSTTTGTPYSILSMLCQDCGVTLGMTRAQIEALTNGAAPIALFSENDCQTYRDVLFWLAQFLACFATINRAGALELRQYTDQVTDQVRETFRFEGSTFSDFVTEYTGAAFTDIESQEYIYIGEEVDTKLTYNLGANPFLQYGTLSTRKQYVYNILAALEKIHYTPFRARYLNTPAYDLGDVIKNPGGLGVGSVGCIMLFEYSFTNRLTVEGFGENPALSTAQDKADKEIAGLLSRTDKNSIYFYTFKNADEKILGDGDTAELINIRFTTTEAKQVTFQAEILADAAVTVDDVVARVSYYLDGSEITDYHPVETWSEDGKHIISLYYMIDVDPGELYRWQVFLNAAGGGITIPPEHARATIWGQGLVAVGKWDGYIDAEDIFGVIELDDVELFTFTAEAEAGPLVILAADPEDTFGVITLDDITVEAFEDVPLFNKESLYLTGTTWQEVKDNTWAQIKDGYTW